MALALDDLHVVSADYRPDRLRASRVQRHINVFTAFRPGLEALGLEAQVAEGVDVAGDWAPRPWNPAFTKRAVSTGVARAAAVLAAQSIDVSVEVEQPARAGWLLRFVSMLAFLWRSIVQRGFTVPDPMTEKQMIEHDRVDHVINGWACLVVGFCALLPLFDPEFSPLQKVWPGVFVLVNVYFFFHVEPWVRLQYGSWLRSLGDKHTFQHRLMTAGGVAAGAIELGSPSGISITRRGGRSSLRDPSRSVCSLRCITGARIRSPTGSIGTSAFSRRSAASASAWRASSSRCTASCTLGRFWCCARPFCS